MPSENPNVMYPEVCFLWTNNNCGDNALLSTGFWLNYTVQYFNISSSYNEYSDSYWIDYYAVPPNFNYSHINDQIYNITQVLYTAVQPEHGGGSCFCVTVDFSNRCSVRFEKRSVIQSTVRYDFTS